MKSLFFKAVIAVMQADILLTIKLQQQIFVDPKRIALLKAIDATGSINQAAKLAKVSYKSAWDHLEAMNMISLKPLLERNTGGKNGGGTTLTNYAKRLLELYSLLENTQQKAFEILQDEQIPLDSLLAATARFSPQSSARNQFFGKIVAMNEVAGKVEVAVEIAKFPENITACITASSAKRLGLTLGKEVMLMVKAPWLHLYSQPQAVANCFQGEILQFIKMGEAQEIHLKIGEQECYATSKNIQQFQENQTVWVTIDPEQIILLTI